jgi:hypothetical protein
MVSHRRILPALVVAGSFAAFAAPALGAPLIAYAKEAGAGFDLYLANPNGTGAVKLYSGPAKNSIGPVDMNPAANEVAIVESRSPGFKIVRYTDAGVRTTVTSFNDGCYVRSLDYHPSDGSLLVNRECHNPQTVEIRRWANGAYGPAFVSTDGQNDAYGNVRWLGDGSGFLVGYLKMNEGASIQRRNLSNPSAPITIWATSATVPPPTFDVARCQGGALANCSKLLYTNQSDAIHELTFTDFGGESDTVVGAGFDPHYSPDNSRILYRAQVKGGATLNVTNPAQLTAPKGAYNGKDWRP